MSKKSIQDKIWVWKLQSIIGGTKRWFFLWKNVVFFDRVLCKTNEKYDIKPMPLGVQCSFDLEIWNLISKCISAFQAGSIDNGYWFLSRLIFFSIKIPSLSFYLSKSTLKYCNPHLRSVCLWLGEHWIQSDMKFVKLCTLADFWPNFFYPKVRKLTFSTFHDKSA